VTRVKVLIMNPKGSVSGEILSHNSKGDSKKDANSTEIIGDG